MLKSTLTLIIILSFKLGTLAQNYTLYGTIRSNTGESIPYATCYDSINRVGVTADENGFFSVRLPAGLVSLEISHVSYLSLTVNIIIEKDTNVFFELFPKIIKEVTIKNDEPPLYKQMLAGKLTIKSKTIEKIPSVLGEPDLLNSIQFLPGISGGKEGYAAVHIRGGNRGQNLILLDGVPIYSTNHLGGLVSMFNPNILEYADVYKGGFPASYGGKLSSVIDVHTKEGNYNTLHGKFSLGILTSSAFIEGPIKKNNTSFLFSVRSSYFDLLAPILNNEETSRNYTFFDINGKINHKIDKNQFISIALFSGHDINHFKTAFPEPIRSYSDEDILDIESLKIHNSFISCEYRNILQPDLLWKTNGYYTSYNNIFDSEFTIKNLWTTRKEYNNYQSVIRNYSLNSSIKYFAIQNHSIKTGINTKLHFVTPINKNYIYLDKVTNTSIDTLTSYNDKRKNFESAIYFEDAFKLYNRLRINAGIRNVLYLQQGQLNFKVEPRFSLNWRFLPKYSLKFNYTRMNQFINMLVNNITGIEREIWIPSSSQIPPQTADQISGGFFGLIDPINIEFSLEGYYKRMKNLLYYFTPGDEDDIIQIEDHLVKSGTGESYGLELYLDYETSDFKSSFSYTLSHSNRKFANFNDGKPFPDDYYKKHDLSYLLQYRVNKTYSIGMNFTFSTGTPVTLPVGYTNDNSYFYGYYLYDGINNYNLPNYHRLDLFYRKTWYSKKNNRHSFSINIYNVYARKNPVYVYFISNKLYKKSLWSIVPSLNYSYEF